MSAELDHTTTDASTIPSLEDFADDVCDEPEGRLDDPLDALLAHLDGLAGVTATAVDAHCCGALGCTRTESRLWRVEVERGRRRTLCPTHAVDFTRREVRKRE